jgi:hypothetical protein
MDHQTVAASLNDGEREMLVAGVSEGFWNVREALDQLRLMVVTASKNFANRTVLDSLVQRGLARLQGYGEHGTNYEITTDGRDVARLIDRGHQPPDVRG